MQDNGGRTLTERVAYLEGRMAVREIFYPTAVEEWELNPLEHPERTLEERIAALERRIDAWSRGHSGPSLRNAGAVLPRG